MSVLLHSYKYFERSQFVYQIIIFILVFKRLFLLTIGFIANLESGRLLFQKGKIFY